MRPDNPRGSGRLRALSRRGSCRDCRRSRGEEGLKVLERAREKKKYIKKKKKKKGRGSGEGAVNKRTRNPLPGSPWLFLSFLEVLVMTLGWFFFACKLLGSSCALGELGEFKGKWLCSVPEPLSAGALRAERGFSPGGFGGFLFLKHRGRFSQSCVSSLR